VAEHRRARVDGGRLPVPFAGYAHATPFSEVLGKRRERDRKGRDREGETQEEEKD